MKEVCVKCFYVGTLFSLCTALYTCLRICTISVLIAFFCLHTLCFNQKPRFGGDILNMLFVFF